ncbi:MAG: response regulator [Desulfobacterales bacterium]|nr:response regulator [Desulfobacterales bacterium]
MSENISRPREADIQIVDDNTENLKVLSNILRKNGHDVRLAISGELALKSIRTHPPDLILLDIMMPDTDGYDVCERLKAEKRTRDIPVIFISALNETVDKVRAFSAGGVDYITKPFREEEVLVRVETHLTLRSLQKELEEKNARLEEKNIQLEEALSNVRTLRGLLPICANCKKIRDKKGNWSQIDEYVASHTEAKFSHDLCDDCMEALYGEEDWYRKKRKTSDWGD